MIKTEHVFAGRGAFYPVMPDVHWVRRVVEAGARVVQLRLKDADDAVVAHQITDCLDVCARHSAQLIVNDYWQAAIDCGADYVHLGQEDLAAADLAAIKSAGLRLGLSTHSKEELAIALDADPDYVALGPVYETILKKMVWDPQGLDRVTEWANAIDVPLIGIGGINLDRATGVFDAGADSIAVVTDVVTATDPDAQLAKWVAWADLVSRR